MSVMISWKCEQAGWTKWSRDGSIPLILATEWIIIVEQLLLLQ